MKPFKVILLIVLTLLISEVIKAQISADSLILDLPFNGNANDVSGNNNNGTVYNAVLDSDRFGNPNSAYKFNGTDSYILIPASPSMNRIQRSNTISISAWINIFRWYQNWNVFSIFERYNPAADGGWLFEANWSSGGILFLANENVNDYVGCNYSWTFHSWHHVCLTYSKDNGHALFYVDGALVGDKIYSQSINVMDTTTSFTLGRSLAGPDEYSDGLIDDVKIYDRVLTSNEIGGIVLNVNEKNKTLSDSKVYPNPAKESVTINNLLTGSNIQIMEMSGKTVYSSTSKTNTNTINTSDFVNGIYIVQIQNKGINTNLKLMVTK